MEIDRLDTNTQVFISSLFFMITVIVFISTNGPMDVAYWRNYVWLDVPALLRPDQITHNTDLWSFSR